MSTQVTAGLTGFAPASDCVRAEYEHTGSNRVNRVCPSLPTVREEYGLIGTTGLKLIVSLFFWVFNVKKIQNQIYNFKTQIYNLKIPNI